MLLFTIVSAVTGFAPWLVVLCLFIYRGIIWEAKYREALQAYVTDPSARKLLGLDASSPTPKIEFVFKLVLMLAIIGAAILLFFETQDYRY